jgi:cytidylate kinase
MLDNAAARIAIVGNAGAGKSTLARALGAERGVPHLVPGARPHQSAHGHRGARRRNGIAAQWRARQPAKKTD